MTEPKHWYEEKDRDRRFDRFTREMLGDCVKGGKRAAGKKRAWQRKRDKRWRKY